MIYCASSNGSKWGVPEDSRVNGTCGVIKSSWIVMCIIKGEDVSSNRTSFLAMVQAIKVIASFLALLVAVSATNTPFPHGRTLVYKYRVDAKAGAIEPAAYASQFALEGTLHVKHDTNDPKLKNAYYVLLSNVKTGMHNGIAASNHMIEANIPLDETAKIVQQPFLIVYDDNGRLQGVKITKKEVGWSRNMKMAMASMLQLDFPNMNVDDAIKAHSFVSNEKTIHGDCSIIYDIHAKETSATEKIIVTKFSSPINCTHFGLQSINHVDIEGGQADKEEPMTIDTRRIFEIERKNGDLIIKKLVALGGVNYLPWNSGAEFHYVLTNATFELEQVVPVVPVDLPVVNFKNLPIIRNLTYQRPQAQYAEDADEDITLGRHVVNTELTTCKLINLLGEAADYIEENHVKLNAPEWIHGQTLNRILHTMSYLDIGSIQHVFNAYQSSNTPRDNTIIKILIGVIPQVGTAATSIFTLNIIRNNKISETAALEILAKLPLTVKVPTENLLAQMEELLLFDESVSIDVKKASLLCFSSLIYRTFKDAPQPEESALLNRYLQDFLDHVMNEATYDMKILYLMAIKNVRVGKIYELLGPIIRGNVEVSENPAQIRLLSIWAINKAVENDYRIAYNVLWPVMADKSLPVKLRIAAYEILMHQVRTQADVFQIRRFMASETNENLYHYHHTTINNIIKSVDPCKLHLRELVTKIMSNTKSHDNIKHILSSAISFDYKIEKYNYLEKLQAGVIINEITGVPEVLQLDNIITDGREPISDISIRLHVQGCDDIINLLLQGTYIQPGGVTNKKVLEILKRASKNYPREVQIDVVFMHMGRVILANHYNQQTLKKLYEDVKLFFKQHMTDFHFNSQHVIYIHLSEKHVISDIGFPVLVKSRLPVAVSIKIKYNKVPEFEPTTMDLGVDFKFWSHGDYSMSIYNPAVDTWHAIRRPTAIDVSLPIRTIINWNATTNNLKLSFRRLSASKPPIAGIRMYVKDIVTVDGDNAEELKKTCPTCNHQEDVVLRKLDPINTNIDSASSGLEYFMYLFDCDAGTSPVTLSSEWYGDVMQERNNTWVNWYVNDKVTMRQEMNNLLPGSMGSMGILIKVEPSKVYSTSRVDMSLRATFKDGEDNSTSFNSLGSKKFNFYGTVDTIASSTNSSARMWGLNVDIDTNQDHTMNTAVVKIIRKTRGEKNLKICFGAQKIYDDAPIDYLKLVNGSTEVVTSNINIAAAFSDDEECGYNGTFVSMKIKAELSDEQKKKLSQELASGACSKDIKNPLYANTENTIPKTLNCLTEAIRYTTLRKYSVNLEHQKVPGTIADVIYTVQYIIRNHMLPNVKYITDHVDAGKIKIKAKFPMKKNVLDLSVVLPMGSFDAIDIPIEIPIVKSLGPTIKTSWYWPLENSRFSLVDLVEYTWDALRFCSIYPQVVLTADGTSVPFNTSERWTLITGDFVHQRFAVFAKSVGNKLPLKIYMDNYEVETVPDANNKFYVKLNGQRVNQLEDGFRVPADDNNWILKLTKKNLHVFVQLKDLPLTIVYGLNHVVLAMDTKLQGKVSGICGHMDYMSAIPESYPTAEL